MRIPDWLWKWQDAHGWVTEEWYIDHETKEKYPIKKRPAKWNFYGKWMVRNYQQENL